MSHLKSFLSRLTFILVIFIGLAAGLRGLAGNFSLSDFSNPHWQDPGPFELSPERGRFGLMYSLVEQHSFSFSLPIARFIAPDVGYHQGHYVSLFAPGISFLIIPGYLLGKLVGLSQIGAFAVISLFALINAYLVKAIALHFKARPAAANLAALTFIFATPAFTYASTLYQHHISTFLVLSALYALVRSTSFASTAYVWLMCALAIPIDYPNLFFLFPLGIAALGRLISIRTAASKLYVDLHFRHFFTLLALLPPLAFFFWFNYSSYGSPLQYSGTVRQVKEISVEGKPQLTDMDSTDSATLSEVESANRSAVGFFRTRLTLNGFRSLWVSPDRGVLYFTPVVLLGFLGWIILYRHHGRFVSLVIAVVGANVAIYSMWSDVYGGWAFGSRYLVPTYALLSISLGIILSRWRHHTWFLLVFLILFGYSLWVNTLGAVTSSLNPPEVEIAGLAQVSGRQEKSTWLRNWAFLTEGHGSKSALYQLFASRYIPAPTYFYLAVGFLGLVALTQLIRLRLHSS